ncbi:MAG: ion transporter [Leptospirales bacterium]|nr:ion transporter [Leptospirales bacterium]
MSERWKKAYNPDHLPGFIETGIIICIILVIGHTVIEDIAVIYHWSHKTLFYLTIASFVFDIIFTLEFAARSIVTSKHGHFKHYMLSERGWIDLLTSFPLLFLVSGPALFFYLTDSGSDSALFNFLVILKTAKAIRVTRILRLIRVIKILGKIQNTESVMTNRHVATISTISVVSLIVVLVATQFIPGIHFGDHADYRDKRVAEIRGIVAAVSSMPAGLEQTRLLQQIIKAGPADVIRLKRDNGEVLFENSAEVVRELNWTAYPGELRVADDMSLRLSFHIADADHAKLNIVILFCILAIIASFMFLYTRIFAQQIADPIYVMDKGLRDWDYNFEVKSLPGRENEEVFKLSRIYNARWLPLKSQIHSYRKEKGETEKSVLTIEGLL